MAQSVKLSNGDYLDTSGIYDKAFKLSQSEFNEGIYHEYPMSTWGAAFNCQAIADSYAWAYQIGKLVIFNINNLQYISVATSTVVSDVNLAELGLPTVKALAIAPITGGYFALAGLLELSGDRCRIRANGAATDLWGQVAYIAAD